MRSVNYCLGISYCEGCYGCGYGYCYGYGYWLVIGWGDDDGDSSWGLRIVA